MTEQLTLVKIENGGLDWHRPAPGYEPEPLPMGEGQTRPAAAGPQTVRTMCGLEGALTEASWQTTPSTGPAVFFPEHGEIRCPACTV